MSVVTGGGEAAGGTSGGGARVFFQSPRGGTGGSPECSSRSGSSREDSAPVATVAAAGQVQQQQRRHQQGKVTVKYDRKELRKRLVLEEWIVEQLGQLYGCEEEEMPDVEIDIDDLLDADSEEERASKLQEALVDCYKPTEGSVPSTCAGKHTTACNPSSPGSYALASTDTCTHMYTPHNIRH